jgi:hypothetical protein
MKQVYLEDSDECAVEGCSNSSNTLVFDPVKNKVVAVCIGHVYNVVDPDGSKEYTVTCLNCGCVIGV